MPNPRFEDLAVRTAAFEWLAEQVSIHGEVVPWSTLAQGFVFRGERVPLVSQQGIFKPRVLADLPLSIRTSVKGPYEDDVGSAGYLQYKYRGDNPAHHENVYLRTAMARRTPLIYFLGLTPGRYLPAWPVYVIADDPTGLTFTVAIDDLAYGTTLADDTAAEPRREYITTTFKRRLHQQSFRERVLAAYRSQCAICRLRHVELLDAAHIIPDGEPQGTPAVFNGLALCKLHHAAFDRLFLAIRPDLEVEVRRDVLEESDGPMLLHGLQELHGKRIHVPRDPMNKPSEENLAWRYERFRRAS